MTVTEAISILSPVGVEQINIIPNAHPDGTPYWKVRQNGNDNIFMGDLGLVVEHYLEGTSILRLR